MAPADGTIIARRGSLQVPSRIFERFFAGIACVILLRDEDDLVVLPVRHAAAGGYLLKLRNAAGDRVVDAADFLRQHGLGDEIELQLAVAWDPARAGLVAPGAFRLTI